MDYEFKDIRNEDEFNNSMFQYDCKIIHQVIPNDFVEYYQSNPYRFVEDFLGIKLPLYQRILFGIETKILKWLI